MMEPAQNYKLLRYYILLYRVQVVKKVSLVQASLASAHLA